MEVKIKLKEDFITLCELWNVDAKGILEIFINHVTIYGTLLTKFKHPVSEASAIANSIIGNYTDQIKQRKTGRPRWEHVHPTKKYIQLMELGVEPESKAFKKIIDQWYASIFTGDKDKPEEYENEIAISKENVIICNIFSIEIEELLQGFIDLVCLTDIIVFRPDNEAQTNATQFFLDYSDSQDTDPVKNILEIRINNKYEKKLIKKANRHYETPEYEHKIREAFKKWSNGCLAKRAQLKEEGHPFEILDYKGIDTLIFNISVKN